MCGIVSVPSACAKGRPSRSPPFSDLGLGARAPRELDVDRAAACSSALWRCRCALGTGHRTWLLATWGWGAARAAGALDLWSAGPLALPLPRGRGARASRPLDGGPEHILTCRRCRRRFN